MEKCSKVGSPVKQWTFQRAKGGQSVICPPFLVPASWHSWAGRRHILSPLHSFATTTGSSNKKKLSTRSELCMSCRGLFSSGFLSFRNMAHWDKDFTCCSSVAQSCPTFCNPMDCSMPGLPVPQSVPKFMSIALVMSFSHPILWHPLLLLPSIFPSIRVFSCESPFASGEQNTGASASISVLPMNIQGWFPLGLTGWSPCCPRNSQDINSLALCLHSSALTTVHDNWEDHSLDYIDICWQSNLVFAFQTLSRCVIDLLPRSNHFVISWLQLLSAVILRAPKEEICHDFLLFPFYLPWSNTAGCHDLSFFSI